jgi:hypothetical protein
MESAAVMQRRRGLCQMLKPQLSMRARSREKLRCIALAAKTKRLYRKRASNLSIQQRNGPRSSRHYTHAKLTPSP